jgi:hypothetical protein
MNNYHYTKAIHLPNIINEGLIRTTTISDEKRELPAVWLSKSEEWEILCSDGKMEISNLKITLLTVEEMKKTMGVCRIRISEKLQTTSWGKFKYSGKVSNEFFHSYDHYVRNEGGRTEYWSCTFKPIKKEYFESIEMLVGDEWIVWDGSLPIEEFLQIGHAQNSGVQLSNVNYGFLEQEAFLLLNQEVLISAWEKNKFKNGYFEMYVLDDYSSYELKFIEGDFYKNDFKSLVKNCNSERMYFHVFWMATKSQYKRSISYDPGSKRYILTENTMAA